MTEDKRRIVTARDRGLQSLQEAFPEVIEVQNRLFGKAGRPGATLLKELLCIDRDLFDETGSQDKICNTLSDQRIMSASA